MTLGVIALAVPGLGRLRGRVPDPDRRVHERLGLVGRRRDRDRARRDVRAAADLGRPAPLEGERRRTDGALTCGRPSSASSSRSSSCLDLPVGLAGGDHRPHVRPDRPDPGAREAAMTLASSIPTPHGRLVRDLAVADAARRLRGLPARRGARARALRGSGSRPGWPAARSSARSWPRRSSTTARRTREEVIANAIVRDRLGALTALIILRRRPRRRSASPGGCACARTWPSTTRCWPRPPAAWCFLVTATSLITLFLALEWFSICLYILCAIDVELEGSLEAGLKYLVVGGFGSAVLLFGSALVYGATGQVELLADRAGDGGAGARRTTRCSSPAWR